MQFKVKNNPPLFSLILSTYGTLDESVQLCNDNGLEMNFDNLSFDESFSLSATQNLNGLLITYNPALVVPFKPPLTVNIPAFPETLPYVAHYGQNLFDICNNTYGTADNLIKLLVDNSKTDFSVSNEEIFNFETAMVKDETVFNYTTGKGYIFSTGVYNNGASFDNSFDESFD